jgi:hypothetical protein
MTFRTGIVVRLLAAGLVVFSLAGQARDREPPYSFSHPQSTPASAVPRIALAPVDRAKLLQEDSAAFARAVAIGGASSKRIRVGVSTTVDIDAARDGLWETQADGSRLWRLAAHADGATDLRFGFARFDVPAGVTLHVVDTANRAFEGPFGVADTSPDRQLWLAPVGGETLTLEVHVPAQVALDAHAIRLTTIATGYRDTTEKLGPGLYGAGPSGPCNVDVICPLGDPYRNEIRAVAKYYFQEGASTFLCTGTLVNNTAQDLTPYFMTANHCISTQASATSMSLIWNYESPTCGQHGGGSTADTQNGGAQLIAHRTDVDFSLVKLNSTPPAAFGVYYAGWDATGDVTDGSNGIHHPSGWVKSINENLNTPTTINSCIGTGGSATHWRIGPYSQGTTEGGSSGSAIFVPAGDPTGHEKLIFGTLSGGTAFCDVPQGTDCYGKTFVAWNGSSAAQRLHDWLDPGNTGATTLPGIDPAGGGTEPNISVTPPSLSGSANAGASTTLPLTIGNTGTADLTWSIAEAPATCSSPSDVPWLSGSPGSGTTAPSSSTPVTVTLSAASLSAGSYTADLCVDSNDPDTAQVSVPVSFTVNSTGADLIFEDGFDGSGGGFQQPLQDPSFEQTAGDAGANPFWSGSDTNDPGGTPFYSASGFGIPVYDGDFEVWFGGWNAAVAETQVFAQTVAIASGGPRYLNYYRLIDVAPEGTATMSVRIDGTEVENVDLDAAGVDADFGPHSIDVSAYANNAAHAVEFQFDHDGTGTDGNTFIDLVTIDAAPAAAAGARSSNARHDATLRKRR